MRKRTKDPNKPIGKMIRIDDFLPPPEQLAVSGESIKITISLNKSSVDFFKQEARRHHTKYQRMIRQLIDKYASRYSRA